MSEVTLRGKRLALVISTAPERGDFERAAALALAARRRDAEVELFVMSDAVTGLPARQALIAELADAGCELVACASSADAAGLGAEQVNMLLGSQDDHAAMVHRAHRLVAFT